MLLLPRLTMLYETAHIHNKEYPIRRRDSEH